MDRLGCSASSCEHVCGDRHLRRLWHEPEHRAASSDHPYRSIGGRATLARARWAVDEQRLPCRTARTNGIGNLALHAGQDDLGPYTVNWRAPSIGMAALDASYLKLNGTGVPASAVPRVIR
jgi:hypothetical protein